ncbi:MAG: hypothetical protein ACK5LZ_05370, partial [Anaerorhabdus sp.]
ETSANDTVVADDAYPADTRLEDGESISGVIVFEIPENAEILALDYLETGTDSIGEAVYGDAYLTPLN